MNLVFQENHTCMHQCFVDYNILETKSGKFREAYRGLLKRALIIGYLKL